MLALSALILSEMQVAVPVLSIAHPSGAHLPWRSYSALPTVNRETVGAPIAQLSKLDT